MAETKYSEFDIVVVKNPFNKPMYHMYDGQKISIGKNESKPFPAGVGVHFGKFLARQKLIEKYGMTNKILKKEANVEMYDSIVSRFGGEQEVEKPEELKAEKKAKVEAKAEEENEGGFEGINGEEVEEEDEKELKAEAIRESLQNVPLPKLKEAAKEAGLDLPKNATTKTVIDAIVEAELAN